MPREVIAGVPMRMPLATIGFWDHQANADAYHTSGYPEVMEILERLLDGTPYVKTFEVVGSTLQRIAPVRPSPAKHLQKTPPAELDNRSTETV